MSLQQNSDRPFHKLLRQVVFLSWLVLVGAFSLLLFFWLGPAMKIGKSDYSQLNPERRVISTEVPSTGLAEQELDWDTGLHFGQHFELVKTTCTPCHSAKLITQNRASREGWKEMLDWMQATQGLAELGSKEELILDYLSTYYAPQKIGRRKPLENIEWYEYKE